MGNFNGLCCSETMHRKPHSALVLPSRNIFSTYESNKPKLTKVSCERLSNEYDEINLDGNDPSKMVVNFSRGISSSFMEVNVDDAETLRGTNKVKVTMPGVVCRTGISLESEDQRNIYSTSFEPHVISEDITVNERVLDPYGVISDRIEEAEDQTQTDSLKSSSDGGQSGEKLDVVENGKCEINSCAAKSQNEVPRVTRLGNSLFKERLYKVQCLAI